MSLKFVDVKKRLPERGSACVIWHRVKDPEYEFSAINTHLAEYDYCDSCWRFMDTGERVEEERKGKVVKYIEIQKQFFNQDAVKTKIFRRFLRKITRKNL